MIWSQTPRFHICERNKKNLENRFWPTTSCLKADRSCRKYARRMGLILRESLFPELSRPFKVFLSISFASQAMGLRKKSSKYFKLFLVFTTYNFVRYPLDFKEVVHLGTWSDSDGDFCVGKIVKSSKRGAMTPIWLLGSQRHSKRMK